MADVLLIEPSFTVGQLHAQELRHAGHDVHPVRSVDEARSALSTHRVSIVVSAVDMAPPGGYGLLRELRDDPRTAELPFVFLSSHPADVVRARAGSCWIDGVAAKGVPGALSATVRDALGPAATAQPGEDALGGTVLVVDDSAVTRAVVRARLETAGLRVIEAADGDAALELAVRTAPDALVLDLHMPGCDGMAVLQRMREAPQTADIPIVMLTADGRTPVLVDALDAGAADFVSKSADHDELVARLRSALRRRRSSEVVARRQARLEMRASIDRLTGLVTRAHAERLLAREAQRAARERRPLAIALLDLDHFKAVNDTHGHAAGDAVLAAVGVRLLTGLRTGDIAARWGGEELLVALPGAPLTVAARRADEVRAAIAADPVSTLAGPLAVTASVGVAELVADGDLHAAIDAADEALYAAKRGGRNRVVVAGQPGGGVTRSDGPIARATVAGAP